MVCTVFVLSGALAIAAGADPQRLTRDQCADHSNAGVQSISNLTCQNRHECPYSKWLDTWTVGDGVGEGRCERITKSKPGPASLRHLAKDCRTGLTATISDLRKFKKKEDTRFRESVVPDEKTIETVSTDVTQLDDGWQVIVVVRTQPSNQPLHHDASGGLTAAVVAGERQR